MKKSTSQKAEDIVIDISSPSSASNVLHLSHSDGSSVSTIVRQLEAKLLEAAPQPSRRSSGQLPLKDPTSQPDDSSIPVPPPSPANSRDLKKSIKIISKLKKSGVQPTQFDLSSPSNFQHNMHVDSELNWAADPQKVLKLGAVLGQGAYGQVVEARYINTDYLMALKIIPMITAGKSVEEVSREINVLRRCRHPNIVSYYGSATTASELWIMMEYCAHGSLGSIIDTFKAVDKQFTEKQLAYLLHQALMGLSYLHNDQIKVIHRDLKCGNILVGEDGAVKLADFGISFQQTGSRSKAATMIGTPLFMAPEMLSGDPYNGKADIWSLGITAIEMADGVPPYFKDHQMRALYRIMHEDPPTLAEPHKWSPQFTSFVAACLKKEPQERPTAAALLEHEFFRQVKPDETKSVMKNLLHQFEDARREIRKRRAGEGKGGDGCLNFNIGGGGGNLTTLSTETASSSRLPLAAGSTGLTTALDTTDLSSAAASAAAATVVSLRSSSSAPTKLTAHQRNGSTSSPPPPDATTSEDDEVDENSSGDEEGNDVMSPRVESKTSSGESAATDGDGEESSTKKGKSKGDKKKVSKKKKSKQGKKGAEPMHRKRTSSSGTPSTETNGSSGSVPAKDRRATLAQMHSGQSSMAFFTGLSRGAQQLLSGAPQAPPPPPPSLEQDGEPRTIEEQLLSEAQRAADIAPPRTMAELAGLVENVDEYLGMPLVQLIYELHSWKKKHALLADELQALKKNSSK